MLNRRDLLKQSSLVAGALSFGSVATGRASAQSTPSTIQNFEVTANGFIFEAISCGPTTGELVLCLHGFPEFKETWIPVIQALGAQGYYAVAVDQRGYSPKARPTSASSYAQANLVSDIVGFGASLKGTGVKFHLIAHDQGGSVGWAFAAANQALLLSTTILATPHLNAFVPAYTQSGNPQQTASSYIPILQGSSGVEFMTANNNANFFGSYNGVVPLANQFVTQFTQTDPGSLAAALMWYQQENFTVANGASVNGPVTYIWGAQDAFLLKQAAVNTANFVTGQYTFVILPNVGHFIQDQVPQDVVTIFLQQVSANLT
ncbi:alpha/beta fold hydrolase [Granulicella sp. S190]|jgi:pimeloyl-ACP methyl ester carboxylesterase|uniref:alpha/beta fold hydrolase n=1 Tax=Granulicella sp. S190 TaxID=1747226 RepID=UPI00131BA585|nr:alpha/beta hydrolase [Granulicella sp. S190]